MWLESFKELLLGLDIYGQPITVHHKGKSKYNTWLGFTCSLIVYSFVLQMMFMLSTAFFDGMR